MNTDLVGKIANELTGFLLPVLPYLIKGAKSAGQEFLKEDER